MVQLLLNYGEFNSILDLPFSLCLSLCVCVIKILTLEIAKKQSVSLGLFVLFCLHVDVCGRPDAV